MLRDSVKHISSALTPGEADPQGDIWEQGEAGEISSWVTQVSVDVALAEVKLHSVLSPPHPPTELPCRYKRPLSPLELALLSRAAQTLRSCWEGSPIFVCYRMRNAEMVCFRKQHYCMIVSWSEPAWKKLSHSSDARVGSSSVYPHLFPPHPAIHVL